MQAIPKKILNAYRNRNILVTGAGGFIGSALIDKLSEVDCTLFRLTRNRPKPVPGTARLVDLKGNIEKPGRWCEVISKVDTIFHFAAQTSNYSAAKDPLNDIHINVDGMIHLLEAVRKARTKAFIIFSGTVTQAGMPEILPVDESIPDSPVTLYDISKLTAEHYLKHYCKEGSVRGVSLRLSNVYGPTSTSLRNDRGVLNKILCMALAEEPLFVFDGGKFIRDYIFIDDVISAFLHAGVHTEKINGKHFIISSGKGITIREAFDTAVNQVALRTGKKIKIKSKPAPPGFSIIETRNFVGDYSAFTRATGWKPLFSIEEGLSKTVSSTITNG